MRRKAQIVVRGRNRTAAPRTAFAEGLRRHGWQTEIVAEPKGRPDLVVLWSVRNQAAIAEQRRKGGAVCILERGYLGDRFAWTSVSFGGGLNGRGEFRGVSADGTRFRRHFGELMQPWRGRGTRRAGYTLLIGQVPGDMSLAPVGGTLDRWYRETAATLAASGHDVRFRPHPGALQRGHDAPVAGTVRVGGTLAQALAGAGLCVTFNSNTAVEAVLAGVPTVTIDKGAMAWPVTAHALDAKPHRPDRRAWAAALAWKQWRVEEMASGECWAVVGADAAEAAA